MTIYLSHSRSVEFRESLYAVLKSSSIWEQYTFVLPHDENDAPFPTKEFFESEECDVILAEVSYPSTGQGIEIGWADTLHIPLVCLYKKNASISQSLYTVTNKFVEYMDEEDLVKKITRVLDHIRVEMKL